MQAARYLPRPVAVLDPDTNDEPLDPRAAGFDDPADYASDDDIGADPRYVDAF